jgi:cysteine desulfuration protein SufE
MTDMPAIKTIQETFALLDNWEDRYSYLIDLGRDLPHIDEAYKTEENLVKGCTSRVWMILEEKDGRLYILADSDALIVRGLIALVISVYHGQKVNDLQNINMEEIFKSLGLSEHLSPNRRNGFFAMVERIKDFKLLEP